MMRLTALAVLLLSSAACGRSESSAQDTQDRPGSDQVAGSSPAGTVSSSDLGIATKQAKGPQIAWLTDETKAFAEAERQGLGVIVDVRSTWCAPCQELDRETFSDPEVISFVNRHYLALQLDVSKQTDQDAAIQSRYDAPLLPAVLFMTADRQVRARFDTFLAPKAFLEIANKTVAMP